MANRPQRHLDKQALFDALGYAPHPGQLPIHRSKARFRVVACGTRFGKTTLAVGEAIAALLAPAKQSVGWTVAPTLDLARLVFDRVVAEVQAHFSHRVKDLSLREQRLVVVNLGGGLSELRGKTTDHPTSLLGAGLDWLIVDEATRVKREVWEQYLSPRLIDRAGWALLVSTPGTRGWFAQLHRRGEKRRDPEYQSWSMPSWTNPHLPRQLIEAERKRLLREVFDSQYGAKFSGEDTLPCEDCGYPDPNVIGFVVLDAEDPEPGRCGECQQPIDASGHTLVRLHSNGIRELTVITLDTASRTPERITARQLAGGCSLDGEDAKFEIEV